MIRAVVFDLYGTLLTGDIYVNVEDKDEALSRILREAGYDVYFQEVWAARQFVMFIDYPRGRANTAQEFYTKVLERLEILADSKLIEKLTRKAAELERVKLFEDVAPTIKALGARGIKTAILTTIPSWRFKHILEESSVKINFICTAKEAKAVKPNPKIYQTVLRKLQVKPDETIMVGDDPKTDIIPAKKMGMKAVMLCRQKKKRVEEADHVIASLPELINIIKETS